MIYRQSFSGHAALVSSLRYDQEGSHVFSIAEQDRFIHVWDCAPDASESALMNLTLETNVVKIDVSQKSVLGITESGQVNIWADWTAPASTSVTDAKKKKKRKQQARACDCTLAVERDSKISIPIIDARFTSVAGQVVLTRGSSIKPAFEAVSFVDPSTQNPIKQLTLTRSNDSTLVTDRVTAKKVNH
jgi:hypothetical protein